MAELKTNYVNDIIDPDMGGRRRYEMVQNDDGTVSFIDRTLYTQIGDTFDAETINGITGGVNEISDNLTNYREWKYVGQVIGSGENLTLPSEYNEICIEVWIASDSPTYSRITQIFPKIVLHDAEYLFEFGAMDTTYLLWISKTSVRIHSIGSKAGDFTNISGFRTFYR